MSIYLIYFSINRATPIEGVSTLTALYYRLNLRKKEMGDFYVELNEHWRSKLIWTFSLKPQKKENAQICSRWEQVGH